jgi:dTDP-4-amino-4,6-dideoxy-D-galactose acyltransferase
MGPTGQSGPMRNSGSLDRALRVCEILPWDSQFFGRRIGQFLRSRCTVEEAEAIVDDQAEAAIDCLYLLIDASDSSSIAIIQGIGAHLADVRVTLAADPRQPPAAPSVDGEVTVRPPTDSDLPVLKEIAAVSHRDTRFYADAHFPTELCDRLYEVWIEKSCYGWADAVLVVDDGKGRAAGYVTCHLDGAERGHIGLFAVREDARGRGIGERLLRAGSAWFSSNGVTSMAVATQGRNVRALQFYIRAGLTIRSVELRFHRWLERTAGQ